MDLLSVVIRADASGAHAATAALDKMTAASRYADAAVASLGRNSAAGFGNVEKAAQAAAREADRLAAKAAQAAEKAQRLMVSQRTNLLFQLNDVGVSLAGGMNPLLVLAQQGSQIAMIYEGGVIPALKETGRMAASAASRFAPLAGLIGIASLGIASLTREINQAGNSSVNFGDVAAAAFQVPANAIYDFLQPAISSVSDWWGREMDIFADQTKMLVNFLTQNFMVAFETIKSGIMTLPDAFIVAGEAAANGFLEGIEWMVQQAAQKINDSLGPLNAFREMIGNGPIKLIDTAGLTFTPLDIGGRAAQGRINAADQALSARNTAIRGTDFGGQWFGAIMDQSAAKAAGRLAKEMEDVGKSAKTANASVGELWDQGLSKLTHWTATFGEAAKSAFSNLGSGIIDAFKKGGDVAKNALDMLMSKVGQLGETLLNNGLNALLNIGLGALGGMFGGGQWGVAGGFMAATGRPGIFGIPGMAEGGTVGRAGLSWVGERGPELLRLPQGAQVIPNGPSVAMAANGNGPNFSIANHIDARGATADAAPEIARQVTKSIEARIPKMIEDYNKNPYRRSVS